MRLILGVAACACFATALSASAQAGTQGLIVLAEDDHHKDEHPQGGPPKGAPPHGTPPAGQQGHGQMGGPNHNANPGGQGQMGGPNRNVNNNRMGGNAMMGHGAPNRNFDRHAYQRAFNAPRHFHVGVYVRPNGWYYRRWTYGQILPALFWSQNYWLGNYVDYGLADPPPGFVWVRYGDDALLVDQNSGEVLQVEYGVFD
jgi:Ni/Co efflux regulator RcnB